MLIIYQNFFKQTIKVPPSDSIFYHFLHQGYICHRFWTLLKTATILFLHIYEPSMFQMRYNILLHFCFSVMKWFNLRYLPYRFLPHFLLPLKMLMKKEVQPKLKTILQLRKFSSRGWNYLLREDLGVEENWS